MLERAAMDFKYCSALLTEKFYYFWRAAASLGAQAARLLDPTQTVRKQAGRLRSQARPALQIIVPAA